MYIDGTLRPANVVEAHIEQLTDDQVLECLVIIRDRFFYVPHMMNMKIRRDRAIELIGWIQAGKTQALRQARKLLIGACSGDRSEDAKLFLEVK